MAERLGQWWARSALRRERDRLPWRQPGTGPWAVLVSEVMLAQTSVARVRARFGPFLERYPGPAAMAADPLGEVLREWSGLGYPRRAAALHRAASVLVAEHGGRVPAGVAELESLPGVGSYTARAVAAFAFDEPVLPVDTNVGRVLARAVAGGRLTVAGARRAGDLVAGASTLGGRRTAQAFMDLGAGPCRPAEPSCDHCPLSGRPGRPVCAWRAGGGQEPDPAKGSAGSSRRQARFEGSFRQVRGRLLRAAAAGPLEPAALALAAGCPSDPGRAGQAAASLVADGLLAVTPSGRYVLP